jgi:hypothetical protein
MDKDTYVSRLVPIITIPKDDDEPPDGPGDVKPPDEPEPEPEPEPSIPFVFDINFNNSLDVDVGGGTFIGDHTIEDGFVTVAPRKHLELDTGFPGFLNNTGDQSWVINFRPIASKDDGIQMWVQTTQVSDDWDTSIERKTGINFKIHGYFLQCEL